MTLYSLSLRFLEIPLAVRNPAIAQQFLSKLGFEKITTTKDGEKESPWVFMRFTGQVGTTTIKLFSLPEIPVEFLGTLTVDPGNDLDIAIQVLTTYAGAKVLLAPRDGEAGSRFAVIEEPVSGLRLHMVRRILS